MQYVIAVHGSFSQQLSPKSNFSEKLLLQMWHLRTTSLFLNSVVLLYLIFPLYSRFPLRIYSLFKHGADCLHTKIYRMKFIYLKEMKAIGTYCMLACLLCPRACSMQVHITNKKLYFKPQFRSCSSNHTPLQMNVCWNYGFGKQNR